jgi:hypothetical protein
MNVPQQKPRDKEKYRQQYLANLQLENSNNTLNLNASKMYKATGASSQVASTTTGAEKLAGLEGLKQIAKDHLVSFRFCNPLSAQDAVDALDPEDIRFVNEYASFISTDFKGRNVPGKVIVNYIKKLRKKLSETEGVDYGIQQSSGGNILLSGTGDVYSPGELMEIQGRLQETGVPHNVGNEILSLMNKINIGARGINLERAKKEGPDRYALALKANSAFRENAPTFEQLVQMIEDDDVIALITALQGAGRIDDFVASVGAEASNGPVSANAPEGNGESGANILDNGHTFEDIHLDKGQQSKQAIADFIDEPIEAKAMILEQLGVDITAMSTEDELDYAFFQFVQNKQAEHQANPFSSTRETAPISSAPGASSIPQAGSNDGSNPSSSNEGAISPLSQGSPASGPGSASQPYIAQPLDPDEIAQDLQDMMDDFLRRGNTEDDSFILPARSRGSKIPELIQAVNDYYQYAKSQSPTTPAPTGVLDILENDGLGDSRANAEIYAWIGETYDAIKPIYDSKQGSPASTASTQSLSSFGGSPLSSQASTQGRGVGKMRGKGIGKVANPRSALHRVDKYEKPKPYRQFGRHLIHRHKLEDGILMLKYPSGATIKEIPTQKVSEDLTKVLKEMADGRLPQYHHFQGLGVKDKELLHSVVRHTQFQNMEVPPPDKEAFDKDTNRFEILKGEIEAGNDNKELIKEFKVMLMKFMRQGRIPKAQVNEIMEHLLMMGH